MKPLEVGLGLLLLAVQRPGPSEELLGPVADSSELTQLNYQKESKGTQNVRVWRCLWHLY